MPLQKIYLSKNWKLVFIFFKVFANEEDAKSFVLGGDSKLKVNMAHPLVERVRR